MTKRHLTCSVVVTMIICSSFAPVAASAASDSVRGTHRYAVGEVTKTYVDKTRPTDANGTFPGSSSREISVLVLYPAKGIPGGAPVIGATPARKEAPYPLIIFSHGHTSDGQVYKMNLLSEIAAAGYVVAAPTFPLSSKGAPGGAVISDYQNQTEDLSLVIDKMIKLNRSNKALQGMIDQSQIGAAGHSLGAITTLGAAYSACCRDKRIDAVAAIAGMQLPFGDGAWAWPDIPIMLIHGDKDTRVPYAGSSAIYSEATGDKFLLTLLSAPHSPFFGAWQKVVSETTVDFFDRYLEGRRASLLQLKKDANVEGVAKLESARP